MKLLLILVVLVACVAAEQRRSAGLTPRHSGYTSTYHGYGAYNPGHGTYGHGYGTYNRGTQRGYGNYNHGLSRYNHGGRHTYSTYRPRTYRQNYGHHGHHGYTTAAHPYVRQHTIGKRDANPEPTYLLHRLLHNLGYYQKHYYTKTSNRRHHRRPYVHAHNIGKRDVALENEEAEALHKIEERHAAQQTEDGETNQEIVESDATHEIERRQAIHENENEIEGEQAHEIVVREAHDPASVHWHSGDHHGIYYGHKYPGHYRYHGYGYGHPWHGGYYYHHQPVRSYTVKKKNKREADSHKRNYWYPYYGHSNWNHGHYYWNHGHTHYNNLHSHGLYTPTTVAHHPKGGHSYVRTSGIGKRSTEPEPYAQTSDIVKRSAEPGTPHTYPSYIHYGYPKHHATYGYNTKVVHPSSGVSYQYHHGGVVPYHSHHSYHTHHYG